MAQLTIFIALVAFGVAHAGVVGVGPTLLGHPLAYNGLGLSTYGAGLGLSTYGAGLGLSTYGAGLYAPGLVAPGVIGYGAALGGGAIASNPGGLIASAVPGVNVGPDATGPSTGSVLAGPTAVLHGSSATLIANTGAVKGHAQAGANLPSYGVAVAPSSLGGNVPASATAILRAGPAGPIGHLGLIY